MSALLRAGDTTADTTTRRATTMNHDQKEALRDCFEGCMSADYAIALISEIAGPRAARDAMRTWERWEREMDEEGYYTF